MYTVAIYATKTKLKNDLKVDTFKSEDLDFVSMWKFLSNDVLDPCNHLLSQFEARA